MRDLRSMERHLPILPIPNNIVMPKVNVSLRIPRFSGDKVLTAAAQHDNYVLALAIKPGATPDDIKGDDLYTLGTLVRVEDIKYLTSGIEVSLSGTHRIVIDKMYVKNLVTFADFDFMDDHNDLDEPTEKALVDNVRQISLSILSLLDNTSRLQTMVREMHDPDMLMNFCAQHVNMAVKDKQEYLELTYRKAKGLKLLEMLARQKESLKLQIEMAGKVSESASKIHRENILREQLKAIKEELGEIRSKSGKKDLRARIEEAGMPPAIFDVAQEELEKMESQPPNSPEISIIRNYLELMASLPWKEPEDRDVDLVRAREILDEDHHGLKKVKELIIQHLAVLKLKKDRKGAVLLLVGPPGVGKTSLGKSIARAMGRDFIRASLGGVRDDAEIRGHRRTYLGALPGRILQSMKKAGSKDPVFVLDEIDKLVRGYNGDPGSSLLEVLDPEQNDSFQDHYLEQPYDLSHVLFLCTANSTENIPGPLLDRMEVIQLSGYTDEEKYKIAQDHLVPKQLEHHGMNGEKLVFEESALRALISTYTRESGVRELQRTLATLCRVYSERVVMAKPEHLPFLVREEDLAEGLGKPRYHHDLAEEKALIGVVTGLAWTPMGGDILFLEATAMPGSGKLTLTGQLGDVMKESAQIALSLVRSHLPFVTSHFNFKEMDIHLHIPQGSIPKDGPSAGIALTLCLASLVLGKPVDPKTALTGEVSLRGTVMPVGGIKEKLIAAYRAGIKTLYMSARNEKDLDELPQSVREGLEIHLVHRVSEVFESMLGLKTVEVPVGEPVQYFRPAE